MADSRGRPLSRPRVATLWLAALLVATGAISFDRARRDRFDFSHFYHDARHVWLTGRLPDAESASHESGRQLPFYLPCVPVLLAPLTAAGRTPAALFWAMGQVASLGLSLRILRGWAACPRAAGTSDATSGPGSPSHTHGAERMAVPGLILAVVLALPALYEAIRFNQLSFPILALVLGGMHSLERERPRLAGALFGLAAVLKLLPALFLPWLLLKRRWSAAAAFCVTGVVVSLVPCLLVLGPAHTRSEHRDWWRYNAAAAAGQMRADLREHFVDHRNQSIAQIIARLSSPTHPAAAPWHPLHFDPRMADWISRAATGTLLCALLAATSRAWRKLTPFRRRAEFAACTLAMLALAPLVRQYYLVWALPALTLFACAAVPRAQRGRWIAWAGLAVWVTGMLGWLWPTARLYGIHLAMLLVMGVLVLCLGAITGRTQGDSPAHP